MSEPKDKEVHDGVACPGCESAPERIWIDGFGENGHVRQRGCYYTKPYGANTSTSYVREDAALDRAIEIVKQKRGEWCREFRRDSDDIVSANEIIAALEAERDN